MSNRCPNDNKFVSLEPEANRFSADVSADENSVEVEIEGTVSLNCAECGETIRETEFSAQVSFPPHDCPPQDEGAPTVPPYSADVRSADVEEDTIGDAGTRKGRPAVVNRRKIYRVTADVRLTCDRCDKHWDDTAETILEPGDFEDLN